MLLSSRLPSPNKAEPTEAEFRTFADLGYDWAYWTDGAGRVLYSSPSCERVTGFRPDEFEEDGRLLARIVHPEDARAWREHVELVEATDRPPAVAELEFRIIAKGGEVRWLHHYCVPVIGRNGVQSGRRASNRDITGRKRAEDAIRLQSLVLDQIADRVTVTDLEGRITYVNDSQCRFVQRSSADLVGESVEVYGAANADFGAKQREVIRRTLAEGEWRGEVLNVAPEGTQSTVYLRNRLVRGQDGTPVAMSGVGTDITELRRVESALSESDSTMRAIFSCMEDLVLVLDRSGRLLDVRSAGDLPGNTVLDVLPGEHAERFLSTVVAAIEDRQTVRTVHPLQIDGRTRWFSSAISPLGGDKVVCVARDITESRQAEEELRAREAKYRAVIETSPDGFFVIDLSGRILEVNDAYVRRSGYSREELLSMRVSDLDPIDTPEDVAVRIEKTIKAGSDLFETVHRAKDGSEWRLEANVSYWPIDDGRLFVFTRDVVRRSRSDALLRARLRLSGMAASSSLDDLLIAVADEAKYATASLYGRFELVTGDPPPAEPQRKEVQQLRLPVIRNGMVAANLRVTGKATSYSAADVEYLSALAELAMDLIERKQAIEALRESEERYRTVVAATNDGIILQSASGECLTWNAAAERVFGVSSEEARRNTATSRDWNTIHEDGSPWPDEDHPSMRTLATGEPCRDCVMGVRRSDGQILWLNVNTVPIWNDAGGAPSAVAITFFDITARKRMEDELRRSLADNQALLREVHHRVKNNLAAVVGLLDLQRHAITDAGVAQSLADLQSRLRSIALVHEKLYRADTPGSIGFEDYLRALLSHLRTSYGFRGELICDARAEVRMSLDLAVPCGMVVNELVTNSLKHAFPEGRTGSGEAACRVTVGLSMEDGCYCLTVSDNGVGLPEGLDPASTRSLGLRLVRMLAEHQLGGDLRIGGERGTSVALRFDPSRRK